MNAALKVIWSTTLILFTCLTFPALSEPSPEEMERWPVLKEAYREQSKGNYRTAIKLYTHAYKESVARPNVVPAIFKCHAALNETKDGLEFVKQAAKENPFDQEIRLFLSDKLHELGDDAAALKELAYVEKLQTTDFRASYKRAMILKRQGKYEEATAAFTHYIEKAKPAAHEAFFHRAQSYQATGKYENAHKDIKRAFEIRPFDAEVLTLYSTILRDLKKYAEAEPFAKQCTEVAPRAVVCWELRGDLAVQLAKNKFAIDHYSAAARIAPEDYLIRAKLATALMANGQHDESDAEFARVFKIKPDHVPAMKVWIESLIKRQNYSLAGSALESFYKDNPTNLWAAQEYARLMSFVGSDDVSAQVMAKAAKTTKSDEARFHGAFYNLKIEKYGRALDLLSEIEDAKHSPQFYSGLVHFKMKKFEKARSAWTQVKSEDPLWPRAQLAGALALERMGKVKEAADEAAGLSLPASSNAALSRLQAYLNEVQNRAPAEAKSDRMALPPEIQSLLDWELPK